MREGNYHPEYSLSAPGEKQEPDAEVLGGQEVADIAASLYGATTEQYRTHLVDANVVLTLAGAKPSTELDVMVRDMNALQNVERMVLQWNALLQEKGIPVTFWLPEGQATFQKAQTEQHPVLVRIPITNRRGFQRMLANTSLLGAERLQPPGNTWNELIAWRESLQTKLTTEQQNGNLPSSVNPDTLLQGLLHGYPDAAIIDFAHAEANDSLAELIATATPRELQSLVKRYRNPEPDFFATPEHATDPAVQKTREEYMRVLRDFYSSEWHHQREQDSGFLQDRAHIDKEEEVEDFV